MQRKNAFTLIVFLLLLALTASPAKAAYTDYIGAGHDDGVTATASSIDEAAVPQNTVNGSGLTGGTHSTNWGDTWTTNGDSGNPPAVSPNPARGIGQWIHYDLGSQYQLTLMHVWNANEVTNRGFNNVTIDYSTNGSTWTELGTYTWPKASGSSSYTGFDGPLSISIVANTGADPSGVQYYFEETSGNEGGISSGWQTDNNYTNHFLNPQTQYTYRVKMRDQSSQLNETGWSDPFSVTTGDIPLENLRSIVAL